MLDQCWAAAAPDTAGPCEGQITKEHVSSKTILGSEVGIRGGRWTDGESVKWIGRDSFVCKCLCRKHNNGLSACDAEARRFQEATEQILQFLQTKPTKQSSWMKHNINGHLFARWMAKTTCNYLAAEGRPIPSAFARFAFSPAHDRSIFVYFLGMPSYTVLLNNEHHGLRTTWLEGMPDKYLSHFMFNGFPFLLSTFDLRAGRLLDDNNMPMDFHGVDRLRRFAFFRGLTRTGRRKPVALLEFNW